MLTLTQTAVGAIEALVGDAPLAEGIRISTAAQADGSTGLALALAEAPAVSDQVIEDGDARVFLEPLAAAALEDKVLDAEPQDEGVRFLVLDREP